MLLDDNCIRADKILDLHPSGFPLICRAETSRRANIRADRTSRYLLSLRKLRSREWHYGIISERKLRSRLSYTGSSCLHI